MALCESTGSYLRNVCLQVMKYIPVSDYKVIRLVCCSGNEAFKLCKGLKFYQYVVDGKCTNFKDCIETLTNSSVPWRTVIFKNIDLETEFMGKPEYFDNFVNLNQHSLTSINFIDCKMRFSRLAEVLAQLNFLKSLRVDNCPLFFSFLNQTILNWAPILPYFRRTLIGLRDITLKNQMLSLETKTCLFNAASNLVSIDLGSTTLSFPDDIRLIAQQWKTLKILKLTGCGNCCINNDVLNYLRKLNLQFLSLDNLKIMDTSSFAIKFFGRQILLRRLQFKNMALNWSAFLEVQKLVRLQSIAFANCKFSQDSPLFPGLTIFNRVLSLETISIQNYESNSVTSASDLSILFGVLRDKLTKFTCTGDFGTILQSLPQSCQNLSVLELFKPVCLKIDQLRHIWKLAQLVKLVIRHSTLKDMDVADPYIDPSAPTLSNLTKLQHLDLSYSDIGDEAIRWGVIKLSNLIDLRLSNTKITRESLIKVITPNRDKILPNLISIEFYACYLCEFSVEDSQLLELEMRPVNLYFDNGVTWTQMTSIQN